MELSRDDSLRIEQALELSAAARKLAPRASAPCFGRLRLQGRDRIREVLLGTATASAPGITLIDWRTAPVTEVFFSADEGDEYELSLADRTVRGRVLRRELYRYDGGELVEILAPDCRLERAAGGWRRATLLPRRSLRPAPHPIARRGGPLDVPLDAAQQAAVDLPHGRPLLLLGEAGFGKTTVALRRLAALQQRHGAGFRAAVIVPTEGLRRLSSALLDRHGVEGVEVWQFDRWASKQARTTFRGLPPRESEDVPSGVIRLKRSPALAPALLEAARRRRVRSGRPRVIRADLQHLFGDSALLEPLIAPSEGAITAGMVRDTLEHTRVQFSSTTEEDHAGTDGLRLETLDGKGIDDATPLSNARTIDPEDYAVLFELDRLRAQAVGAPPARINVYDCLVIDEAQELAPIELSLLQRALAPGGSLVVAGDAAQQVDPTAVFLGWDRTMSALGAPQHEKVVLQVSYRCPPEVTALARRVLDPTFATGPTPSVGRAQFATELHLCDALIDELLELRARDPRSSVALICRSADAATRLSRPLGMGLDLRLALEGDFDFGPGVQLTCVPEVKGLEFDHVIVPDASAQTYSATADARRALYVAITRASHQLLLCAAGSWSPLLDAQPSAPGELPATL